jgi:hypothetical protein
MHRTVARPARGTTDTICLPHPTQTHRTLAMIIENAETGMPVGEPRARFYRYVIHEPPFLWAVLKQRLGLYRDPFGKA